MRLLFERRWDENRYVCLKSITEIIKNFKSLYGFEGRCLKIRDVCMDFEAYFKVHSLVSVHPKGIIQMTSLDIIFYVVVSVYRFVEIWNSLQFPVEFRNGQCETLRTGNPERPQFYVPAETWSWTWIFSGKNVSDDWRVSQDNLSQNAVIRLAKHV